MMEIEKAALHLPDGSYIKVETSAGDVKAHSKDNRSWESLDVSLVNPSGFEELICCIDYEDRKGLRVIVYEKDSDIPVYEHLVGADKEKKE